jgi:hypothetical protein
MKFCFGLLLCISLLHAQVPGDADVARAQAGIEKLRQLVEAGAAPRAELEQAEQALADARDFSFLRQTLYGTDLTESQAGDMIRAAGRRLDRRKQALEHARGLVALGVASQASLGTFLEALDWAQKEYDLAEARAKEVREVARMASAEQDPDAAHQIAQRYDGEGVFTPGEFRKVERDYTLHFSKPLPVSAMGQTAVHSALGFDHRGRVDVALNPDQPEGKWLRAYLEVNRIPFFAFRQAVPGKATGAHIHIGPMSTRLATAGTTSLRRIAPTPAPDSRFSRLQGE